jgi:acetylornithine deacetylase/succinyl-diaminopimelate desuccinylase-like protein
MNKHSLAQVVEYAEASFDDTLARLVGYLGFEAISCDPAHYQEVHRLADQIAADLSLLGLQDVQVCHLEGALPMVVASHMQAGPTKPTVLIYGHLDLQPVKGEVWKTNPHEATQVGDRLYARGAADDMGGWVSHLAAIEAYLAVKGELPCNIKLVIEGEEEIGSPNLERFMDAYPQRFEADAMVLTDCENPSTEIPGLTVSLRGLMEVDVTCEALFADVHSGLWGNMVPDVSTGLILLLNRLLEDDGRFAMARQTVSESWRTAARKVPLNREVIKTGAHMLDDVEPLPEDGRPAAEWLWRQPAITVLSTTLPSQDREKNALRSKATATLSIRVAPGQTADDIKVFLEKQLLQDVPGGLKVNLNIRKCGAESWLYEPSGPAFDAVDRAYTKAWGVPPLRIGVGGSIPFVAMFGRRFSDLPLILNGVMDPETGAHGPNESLHLGVFRKTILSNVYLLDELSQLDWS